MPQRLGFWLACTLMFTFALPWPVLPAVESPPPAGTERAAPPATETSIPSVSNRIVQDFPGHYIPYSSAVPPAGKPASEASDPTGFLGIIVHDPDEDGLPK